jgi:hypothetical protein
MRLDQKMSRERELLVEAVEWMHELKYVWANVRDSGDYDLLDLIAGINKIEKLLAQPEQTEPLLAETKIEWYGKGFRQGVNEFAPPKPLTEDVIYALDKEGIVENMDDHQVRYVIRWIRSVEKAHGIGGE